MAILKGLGAEPAHCVDVYTYIYIDVTQTPKNLIPERSSCGFSHRCCIVFLTLWSFCCLGPALESCYAVDRCVSPCRLLHGLKSICQACCDPLSFLRRKHAKARAQEICPRGAFAWLQYISHTTHKSPGVRLRLHPLVSRSVVLDPCQLGCVCLGSTAVHSLRVDSSRSG